MIRCGLSTPQRVVLAGTAFPVDALVLLTVPNASSQRQITPVAVTTTAITFEYVFATCGTYTAYVVSAASLCDADLSSAYSFTLTPDPCPRLDAPLTLGDLRRQIQHRLGDDRGAIWSDAEVVAYVNQGYRAVATELATFYDVMYPENLPRGFSVTQPWELEFAHRRSGGFDYGVANFTAEFERTAGASLGWREQDRIGPGNHTSPFEATDGLLIRAHASTDIPATSELPKTLTQLDRVSWDNRAIEALEPRTWSRFDGRYEITKGEVYGFMWQKDGVRTLRKVRVPAMQAMTVTVIGSWGLMRTLPVSVVAVEGVLKTADGELILTADGQTIQAVEPVYGVVRRIGGHHPLRSLWGFPRRVYLETANVRVEHFRLGHALTVDADVCELPTRYAFALRDYAQARCFERPGPGYDAELAAHFEQRWQRVRARLERRLQVVDTERVHIMGGDGRPNTTRPPRPALPWAYGSRVR